MVEREAEIHHRLDPDHAVESDRPLDDGLHREDARLPGVDDRVAEQRPERPGVVDREGAAAEVVRFQLLVACSCGDVVDGARKTGDREPVRASDDGHDQRVLQADRDAQVDVAMDDQLGLIESRVDLWVLAQRGEGGGHHVREIGERKTFLLLERRLVGVAVGNDAGHVRFLRLPSVGDGGLGADHVLGDQAPYPRELNDLVAFGRRHWRGRRNRWLRGKCRLCGGRELLHVLLGHAAADPGTLHLRQIHAELARLHLDGGRIPMLTAVEHCRLRCRGRDGSGLASRLGSWLGLRCRRSDRRRWRSRHFAVGADLHDGDLGPRLNGLSLLGEDLAQDSADRRRNLRADLVGVDLEQGLELGHLVARLNEPARDGPLVHRLAQLRHDHSGRRCHG